MTKKPLDFREMKRRSGIADMCGYGAILASLLMVNLNALTHLYTELAFLYVPLALANVILMVKRAEQMGELKAYQHINSEFHTMVAVMFQNAIANVAEAAGGMVQEIAPVEMTKH